MKPFAKAILPVFFVTSFSERLPGEDSSARLALYRAAADATLRDYPALIPCFHHELDVSIPSRLLILGDLLVLAARRRMASETHGPYPVALVTFEVDTAAQALIYQVEKELWAVPGVDTTWINIRSYLLPWPYISPE